MGSSYCEFCQGTKANTCRTSEAQGAEPADYLFDVEQFLNPSGVVDPEPVIQPVRSLFTRLISGCTNQRGAGHLL